MLTLENLNLKTNPFRTTPSLDKKDLVWAGFQKTKERFEKRIKRSLGIPNSSIVLNWGEYGSGKTHAARFFSQPEVLSNLSQDGIDSISLILNFPKGKNVIWDIFCQIVDRLDLDYIHSKLMQTDEIKTKISQVTDSFFAQSILNCLIEDQFDSTNLKKFLYGEKNGITNVLRPIQTDSDYVDILSAFISLLTNNHLVYRCFCIWIDEFEDIAYQTTANTNSINNFIKVLLDKTPNGLLMFINFTQSAMAQYSDLGAYLQPAVTSRIKDTIELAIPSREEIKDYLKDLLSFAHIKASDDLSPFSEDMIDSLLENLNNVSIRRINEALSLALESALFDDKTIIDIEYYNEIKTEILGSWKDA